jgi:hypothetical protein
VYAIQAALNKVETNCHKQVRREQLKKRASLWPTHKNQSKSAAAAAALVLIYLTGRPCGNLFSCSTCANVVGASEL